MNPVDTLARSDSQDDGPVENPVTDVIQVTSYSEPTTENSLPLGETVQDVKSSTTTSSPSELLSSEPSDSVAEDVTESIPVDEPIQDTAKPLAADVPQVSSEAPAPAAVTSTATPMDLVVPIAPSNPTTVAATLLPLEPVAPPLVFVEKTTSKKVAEVTSPQPTDLPLFSPVKIPKVTVLNNTNGGVKKINNKTTPPQVNTKVSQYRPIPSYNPPDSINPYLGEEQDKPIYLPPTFTGPNALPSAINLYSSSSSEEADNFPIISRPGFAGPSSIPKKLDFTPISNTDENFGYQVNWW